MDNVSHTWIIRLGVAGAGDLDKTYTVPALYSIWTKAGDGCHYKTPIHTVESKCSVSNNAKAKVRQWLETIHVEDEDGHHKSMSKCYYYNGP